MRRSKKEAFGWPAQQDLPKRGLIVMHIYKFALLIVRALKYKYKIHSTLFDSLQYQTISKNKLGLSCAKLR